MSNKPNRKVHSYKLPTHEQRRWMDTARLVCVATGCTCEPTVQVHRDRWLKVGHDDDCPLRNRGPVYVVDATGRAS